MRTNKYKEMKARHQKDIGKFPFIFAFSDEQFKKGMRNVGLKETDIDQIECFKTGIFYKKSDRERLIEMFKNHSEEKKKNIDSDKTGYGFILDMFSYELKNHEYLYTLEIEDTLEYLGYLIEDINNNPNLKK